MPVIIKTKMKELPQNCKECQMHVFGNGVIMCGVARDWLTPQEFQSGKIKLDNCPLEETK